MSKRAAILLVVLAGLAVRAEAGLLEEARGLFEQGKYMEGTNIVLKAMQDDNPETRAAGCLAYGRFQEHTVGNVDIAMKYYSDVVRAKLPAEHDLKAAAKGEITRLGQLRAKYRSQDAALKKIKVPELLKPEQVSEQAGVLEELGGDSNYYRRAEVCYHLGRNYYSMGRYREAYEALKEAERLKPGINFYMPVKTYCEMAYSKWVRSRADGAIKISLGILMAVMAGVFYTARPWRWVKWRHVAGLAIAAVVYTAVFAVAYKVLVSTGPLAKKTVEQAGVVEPYFMAAGPGSPSWGVVEALYVYGLVAVAGAFVFAAGVGICKRKWVTVPASVMFSVMLSASLVALFYMRYCDQKSMFSGEPKSVKEVMGGSSHFVTFAIEPYILTNPRAYPDLMVENVTDRYLYNWIKTNCPFTKRASLAEDANR